MALLRPTVRVQTRTQLIGSLLLYGVLVGSLSAAVGAGDGIWRYGPGLSGAVKGMDMVGMVVCLLSAWLMYGSYLTNRVDVGNSARLGQHQHVRLTRFPLFTPLVVLLGGLSCQGLVLLLHTVN